jgi:hypothetical protein
MTGKIENFSSLLREAIADARAAGLGDLANLLEQTSSSAYTTSSEFFGETGQAIVEFLHAGGKAIPPALVAKLTTCLQYVQGVWPSIRI